MAMIKSQIADREALALFKNAKAAREEAARTGVKPMTDWQVLGEGPALEGGARFYRYAKCMDGTIDMFNVFYDPDWNGPSKWQAWFWHAEYADYPIDNYKEMLMNDEPFEGPGWDEDDFNMSKGMIEYQLEKPEHWARTPFLCDYFYDYLWKIQEYVPWEQIGVKDIYGNNPKDSIECFVPLDDIIAYAEKLGIDMNFRDEYDPKLSEDYGDYSNE